MEKTKPEALRKAVIYLYDGTFAGLLTVFDRLFTGGAAAEEIRRQDLPQPDLFACTEEVGTDPEKAGRLLAAVERKLSRAAVRNLYHAFLSEAPGVETTLYRYLALGRRRGGRLDADLAHPDVSAVHRRAQRVRSEAHRMKGLIRFRELADGLLYAPIAPDANVLSLIAPHFAARLSGERFLIHDTRRSLGVFFDGKDCEIGEVAMESEPEPSRAEAVFSDLWRRFFAEIAIPERTNPRLQKNHMPVKYWRYLTEMEGK